MTRNVRTMLAIAGATVASAAPASADIIFDTGAPDGGFFGYTGYDIYPDQDVGVAFTPASNSTLNSVGVWIMSNDFDNPGRTFTLSLHTNAPGSNSGIPSNTVLESWNIATSAVGWNPVLESVTSSLHPLLNAGQQYWLVATSNEPGGLDPVWVWGSNFDPIVSGTRNSGNPGNVWETGPTQGSAPGAIVDATIVPAPPSVAILGLAGLTASRRRRTR
jgi:hypothetical protein